MKTQPLVTRYFAALRWLLPFLLAGYIVFMFSIFAPRVAPPHRPDLHLQALPQGMLTEAQTQTLDMVKELNAYLISMTTLMFGGLGWYLSQYRPTSSPIIRAVFFSTVGFLVLASWYAAMAYARIASDLSQNALNFKPGESLVLFYVQLEFAACAVAAFLVLFVFADAVTRRQK